MKRTLRVEPFLEVYHRSGIPELVKIRGGTNRLRIEQGRYVKEEVEERVCVFCDAKQVEDEKHFMLACKRYEDLRETLWKKVEVIMACKRSEMTEEEQMNALIGDKFQPEEEDEKDSTETKAYRRMTKETMKFVTEAMKRRRDLQETMEGVKSSSDRYSAPRQVILKTETVEKSMS